MLDLQPSTFEDFARAAERGNIVPIVRTLPADLLTPVAAFLRITNEGDAHQENHKELYAFLLESVEGGATVARYTFLGASPEMIVRGRDHQTIVERDGVCETYKMPVTDFLREHFATRTLAKRPRLPPLAGGCIGYLAYEAAALFESALDFDNTAKHKHDDEEQADDLAVWMFFRNVLAFDHVKQLLHITSVVELETGANEEPVLRERYNRAVAETERIARQLMTNSPLEFSSSGATKISIADDAKRESTRFKSSWTQVEFETAVDKIKDHIVRGDCYQSVISQRFTAQITAAPFEIYRALRRTNPAPYMYFLRLGQTTIVGASPEMLVRVRSRKLEYRPIAGTRPRGNDEQHDEELAREMRADEKECAEHIMLVDLGRNDLGRVARTGSVHVEQLMHVERYAHVQHLVSSLRAELDETLDRFDALAACFPAGTVTGAPKIRAMQIVRELEPHARGVYAGAICYVDYADNLDSCIAIRTLVVKNNQAHVQAGAGIVADSVPALEYEETINKARAMMCAVESAEAAT